MGSAAGVSDAKIHALDDYARSALFDERERAALVLADAMTRTPQVVTDEMVDRVRAAFGVEATVELMAVVAWENAMARLNHGLGVPSRALWKPASEREGS